MRLAALRTVSRTVLTLHRKSRVAILLLGVLVLCSACGATPQAATAATTVTTVTTVTTAAGASHSVPAIYSATARVQSETPTSVSVSCRSGEQMLGGGFAASNLFEYAAYIEASYPSGGATWTVTASAPASYFDLEAQVYCLPAATPIGLRVVHASGAPSATATCPQDTVLLSSGFQGIDPVATSRPQGNGWQAATAYTTTGASLGVYALCAARFVLRGQVVTATFNPHSTTHNYTPGAADAACPAGQIAFGGGFADGDLIVASQTSGSSFTGWSVAAGGDADVTVSALCVQLRT